MAIPKRNMRCLQDIRTLSGGVDQTALPHKAYMKVACLEMEKARRGKERESALFRVKTIDARVEEIEDEKAALLQAQAERDEERSPADGRHSTSSCRPEPVEGRARPPRAATASRGRGRRSRAGLCRARRAG